MGGPAKAIANLDPAVGPITTIDKSGMSALARPFRWFLANHAAVSQLRSFLENRMGRFAPFWLPTWTQDLTLALDVFASDTGRSNASGSSASFA